MRKLGSLSSVVGAISFLCALSIDGLGQTSVVPQTQLQQMTIAVRDSSTGFGVASASVRWAPVAEPIPSGPLPNTATSNHNGILQLNLPAGEYAFEISASGYQTLRTHYGLGPGTSFREMIALDPVSPPKELEQQTITSELQTDSEFVHGFVVDSTTYQPLLGVEIRFLPSGRTAVTNARGYFATHVPAVSTKDVSSPEAFPARSTLTASLKGYKIHVVSGLLHVPGSESGLQLEMTPGTGTETESSEPGALRGHGTGPAGDAKNVVRKDLRDWLSGSTQSMARGNLGT